MRLLLARLRHPVCQTQRDAVAVETQASISTTTAAQIYGSQETTSVHQRLHTFPKLSCSSKDEMIAIPFSQLACPHELFPFQSDVKKSYSEL